RAAAAWVVHRAVERGLLVPEIRQHSAAVGLEVHTDPDPDRRRAFRAMGWEEPIEGVSIISAPRPMADPACPIPFDCLLVLSTPQLWLLGADSPSAPRHAGRQPIDTRPKCHDPLARFIDAAERDAPGAVNDLFAVSSSAARDGVVRYTLVREKLEAMKHRRDAAEWAIFRHVEQGRLVAEPGVDYLPQVIRLGEPSDGRGQALNYTREGCHLRPTQAFWEWWKQQEEAPPAPPPGGSPALATTRTRHGTSRVGSAIPVRMTSTK
ncbi:MAG TPA: hypothetical protein VKE74_30265, partial [Gemmataceae bacterium]|nr:hypothetical protein [Gemmataceae bacterium]